MRGKAWGPHRQRVLVALVAGLVLVSPAAVGLAETSQPTSESLEETEQEPRPNLLAPLLQLADTPKDRRTLTTAYATGQAWAHTQLAEPGDLPSAVDTLYTALGLDAVVHADPVPETLRAPMTALVTLQAHHAAQSGPYNDLDTDTSQAFTLGALTPVIDALEQARHDAPEDPVFVDPLGLIVLGGSGDNTYEPKTVGPSEWSGPILLIEPAGNDTYDVRVASPTAIDAEQSPVEAFQIHTLALELGGNDTYREKVASAIGIDTQSILLDRHGNDTYGKTGVEKTTAHASPGFAYLLDEEGNDTYQTQSRGIAQSELGGTAVLWDPQGNDTYVSADFSGIKFTHAMAHSEESKALLWDETGNDRYHAHRVAYGSVFNDGVARLVDEEGDDTYRIDNVGFSFGNRSITLHSPFVDRPLNRGLGEFIDGSGEDTYDWNKRDPGDPLPENDKTRVDDGEDLKWGIFIDCETAADADRPCEDEQRYAHCTVLRNTGLVPSPVEGLLDPVLEDGKQACLNLDA